LCGGLLQNADVFNSAGCRVTNGFYDGLVGEYGDDEHPTGNKRAPAHVETRETRPETYRTLSSWRAGLAMQVESVVGGRRKSMLPRWPPAMRWPLFYLLRRFRVLFFTECLSIFCQDWLDYLQISS